MSGLDDVDRCLVAFVRDYHATRGYAPTLAEIGRHLGMTAPGARERVRKLVRAGHLARQPGRSRTIRVAR